MIPLPSGVRVWLATGHTDMRKGFASLSLQVQHILHRDPLSGHLFCFRGRRGDLLKVIWHDGQGACRFSKRLERGRFLWPTSVHGPSRANPSGVIRSACRGKAERSQSRIPARSKGVNASTSPPYGFLLLTGAIGPFGYRESGRYR